MATTYTNSEDLGKLILRISLGVTILLHGISKLIGGVDGIIGMVEKSGMPGVFGYLVYLGEVLAPLLLIVGLWTRLAALVIVGNMVVAVVLAHMADLFT
ncbi:MAG: DoxX family protein, partial [Burkholderiales bacterium]